MRIAIVTEFFPKSEKVEVRGGVEARAFHVAKHLAKAHDVTILTSRERNTRRRDEFLGIEVLRLGKERKYSQTGSLIERLSFAAEGRGMKREFDVVDGYNFVSYLLAWGLSRRSGASAIATYHDVWVGEWIRNIGVSGVFGELLERYVLSRKWDKFIAVSNHVKNKLLERGVAESRVKVVPNGIEIGEYEKVKVEKYPEPTVCCIARLVGYKRVGDLIKALEVVKGELPDVKCKIIGVGPQENYLKSLVGELGLKERVEFLGFVEKHQDVVGILKSSHVLCLPSTVEGFGLVLLEAMASGVPYVASKIPPLVETTGGKGGVFFEPMNQKDLADKLQLMLKDGGLREKLANQGQIRAREYDWEKICAMIEDVYGGTRKQSAA